LPSEQKATVSIAWGEGNLKWNQKVKGCCVKRRLTHLYQCLRSSHSHKEKVRVVGFDRSLSSSTLFS
jgi:hypothetical protein